MTTKLLFQFMAAGMLTAPAVAQEIFKSFDIYSEAGCGENLSALSETLDIFPFKDGDDTSFITHCAEIQVDLSKWPQTNSQYTIYIDTTPIDDKCQLIFYTGPPSDDEVSNAACFQYYRAVNSNSGCALLSIPKHFGYAYCCHDKCSDVLGQNNKRGVLPPVKANDVTQVKRSPLLKRKKDDCKFVKTGDEVKTTYGPQQKVSSEQDCPSDSPFGCPLTGDVSLGQTIGTSTSLTVSTGFTAGFLGIGASAGIDTTTSEEWSSSTTFSVSYSMSVGAGDKAYLTFMPKYKCVNGKFEGKSCEDALKTGEQLWCVPALIEGNVTSGQTGPSPDGIWSVVVVN